MKVDRNQFLEEGYVVLRNVIPADELEALRASYEILVERQKVIWAQERKPDDPPGGVWEASAQPRLLLQRSPLADLIDKDTSSAVEIWLHENTQGASSELLGVPDAAVTEMMLMCNPVQDRGPAHWHRDLYPPYGAPLQGYVDDIIESGPRYVQWNLCLYDDDVLWVVPGSHARLNTDRENELLRTNRHIPFPGGVQTHLNAGDGVAYILPILHWGSNYSTKMRRTIHGGFSTFTQYENQSYMKHLSTSAQETFERWIQRSDQMITHTESILRAAIKKDAAAYHASLEKLHPGRGEKGKILSTVYLSKIAQRVYDCKHPDFEDLPQETRDSTIRSHPITLQWGLPLADRFSFEEARTLWDRFKPVDARVQSDVEGAAPGYENRPSRYHFNEMPSDFSVDDFTAPWMQSR